MENPFFTSMWPGIIAWALLYISDYALTIKCARLYKSGPHEKLVMEGSYELTPYFQKDIDSFRVVSPRFLVMLMYTSVLIAVVWMLSLITFSQLYSFGLGAMILLELNVHLRHLHNFFSFRAMGGLDAPEGRIEYKRSFILRISARDLFAFSGFYLVLFGILQNWFFLGGAVTCVSNGIKHLKLARKSQSAK